MYSTTSTLSSYYQTMISIFLELKVFRGLRVHGEEPEEKHCFYSLLRNLTTTRTPLPPSSPTPLQRPPTAPFLHLTLASAAPGAPSPQHRRSCGRVGRSRGATRSRRSCPEPAEERERNLRGGGAAGPRQRRPEGGRTLTLAAMLDSAAYGAREGPRRAGPRGRGGTALRPGGIALSRHRPEAGRDDLSQPASLLRGQR